MSIVDSFTCYQHNLWTGYLQLVLIYLFLEACWLMNSLKHFFFFQVPFISTIRHVLAAAQQCLAEKLLFRPSCSRQIKHGVRKQLMGCVMMECGADREEKNSEAMSKSKTTARMVGGPKVQQQRWGQRREKGCECIDPSHNLHFWTRTSLQTVSCPHFLFIILEVEEVTPKSSIYHFLSSYIKHLHKIQDSAPHNSRWKRQRRPNSSMRWKLTSVSTKKTAYPGGRRETE